MGNIDSLLASIQKEAGTEDKFSNISMVVTPDNWREVLNNLRVSFTETYIEPLPCIEITDEKGACRFGTLGNFSAIIGKAKSRKTFFISLIIGAAYNDKIPVFKISLPKERQRILYFDTEQSKFDISRVANRIQHLGEVVNPANLEVYGLRSLSTAERLLIIEHKIYECADASLVVIDGIRDLINDINDPCEATMITCKLLKWTEQRDIHIITVLHQNKGNEHARGHVGTEIINKAETVVSVEKDGDVSLVKPEFTRGRDFSEFAFSVDANGLPYLLEEYTHRKTTDKKARLSPYEVPQETHLKVLQDILKPDVQLIRKDLESAISVRFKAFSIGLTTKEVCEYISYYQQIGLLENTGGKGRGGNHFYLKKNQ